VGGSSKEKGAAAIDFGRGSRCCDTENLVPGIWVHSGQLRRGLEVHAKRQSRSLDHWIDAMGWKKAAATETVASRREFSIFTHKVTSINSSTPKKVMLYSQRYVMLSLQAM
jgi:hypothetical protein